MPTTKKQRGGARPGAGRPSIRPDEATVTIHIRVSESQRDKFNAVVGSDRFRKWLDRVKVKA